MKCSLFMGQCTAKCVNKNVPLTPEYTLDGPFPGKKVADVPRPKTPILKCLAAMGTTSSQIQPIEHTNKSLNRQIFFQEIKPVAQATEIKRPVKREDLAFLRRQFFSDAMSPPVTVPKLPIRSPNGPKLSELRTEQFKLKLSEIPVAIAPNPFKSNIPVFKNNLVARNLNSKIPVLVKNDNIKKPLATKIPQIKKPQFPEKPIVKKELIPVARKPEIKPKSVVKKPIPTKPFYTNFLYDNKRSQIAKETSPLPLLRSGTFVVEDAASVASSEEIYLIDDEISDQPELTFNFRKDSYESSLSSVESLRLDYEEAKEYKNNKCDNPSQSQEAELMKEISSLKISLETLKQLLLEQEKREKQKDLFIRQFIIKQNYC